MTNFYLDIETGPSKRPGIIAELMQDVKPPANYKKPETIAKWMEEHAEDKAHDLWQKTSLDASQGYIASIGYAINDSKPYCLMETDPEHHGDSELHIISRFFEAIKFSCDQGVDNFVTIIGHNVSDFDIPFIIRRAMVLGIKPPSNFPTINGKRNGGVYDTMKEWSGYRDRISQDALCKALGIEGKPETGPVGATVWQYLTSGKESDLIEVRDYNIDDVEKIRKIHKRMTFTDAKPLAKVS